MQPYVEAVRVRPRAVITSHREMREEDQALLALAVLKREGYRFTCVTPDTHARVVARLPSERARDLRDISGSAPFDESDLPGEILHLLHAARAVECVNSRTKSLVRFATFDGLALFPQDVDVGLIGVTEKEAAGASNRDMPYAVIVGSAC